MILMAFIISLNKNFAYMKVPLKFWFYLQNIKKMICKIQSQNEA